VIIGENGKKKYDDKKTTGFIIEEYAYKKKIKVPKIIFTVNY